MSSLSKADAPKYTSRKRGASGAWEYTYASDGGGPKTRLGLTSKAASHAAKAEGHRADAESHAKNGNLAGAKISKEKAAHHDKQADKYSRMSSKMGREQHRASSERIATPSEMEHASRAPGGDKRMATAGEAGRFAIKHPDSSPWDNKKSMRGKAGMSKSKKIRRNLKKALDMSMSPENVNASYTRTFGESADGLELLNQMIQDYESANFGSVIPTELTMPGDGAKDLEDEEAKGRAEAAPTAETSTKVDFRGNAPHLPYGKAPVATPVAAVTPADASEASEPVAKSAQSAPAMVSQDQISTQAGLLNFFANYRPTAYANCLGKVV